MSTNSPYHPASDNIKTEPKNSVDNDLTPFILHPNYSRYYSFVFVVAKCISDVLNTHDVLPDGSCGYHAFVRAILHYIATFPDDTERFFNIGILDINADHEGMTKMRAWAQQGLGEGFSRTAKTNAPVEKSVQTYVKG